MTLEDKNYNLTVGVRFTDPKTLISNAGNLKDIFKY